MKKDKEQEKAEVFTPYYINQSRLLDIYSILNKGYSEYTEITTGINAEKSKNIKADGKVSGGFKIVNLGGDLSGEYSKIDGENTANHEKKVQTITSILSMVQATLLNKGYLHDIELANAGDFVCLPVNLRINSMKSLLSEMTDLLKLINSMKAFGVNVKTNATDMKNYEVLLKSLQTLFAGEEIIYETDLFAITGNIIDENLYQGTRADIISAELTCLAQVKRVFPNGTELMKNTVFTRIKDTSAKQKLIDSLTIFTSGEVFDFEATAVSAIHDKPVYQLEIIALYQ